MSVRCSGGSRLYNPGVGLIFWKQLVYRTFDFILDRSDGNAKYALSPPEDVDEFLFGVSRLDGLTVAEERDVGQGPIGVELCSEDFNR